MICLFIYKLKSLLIHWETYCLCYWITYYLLHFYANDLLKIWPTIFFFKMRNVRLCKYRRPWCDCYKNWFHQHCKNFECISNTNINLSQWYCSSCDQIPFVHLNSLPYLVLDKFFTELCITEEKTHLTLALVCKKWKFLVMKNLLREFIYSGLIKNITLIPGHYKTKKNIDNLF